MIGKKSKDPINAADELARREGERIEGARGAPLLGQPARVKTVAGGKVLMASMAVCVLAAGGVFAMKATSVKADQKKDKVETVKNTNPNFKLASLPNEAVPLSEPEVGGEGAATAGAPGTIDASAPGAVPGIGGGTGAAAPPVSPPPSTGTSSQPKPPSAAELLHQRRLSSDLGDNSRERLQRVSNQADPRQSAGGGDTGGGALQEALRPMRLTAQQAAKLTDRNTLLTQGAMIDCVLETKIVSTVAGMTACYLTRDVYSSNGRVVLLDRGSKVVGFYQGGISQGEARIFVQWSRVETPKGVIVNLDSPGAGPLGESGVGGYIDTHFKERFGGAILLSMIDDLGDYFANKNNSGQSQSFQFGNSTSAGQELARTTLQNSINVKPTLYKNQGERLTIFVARDLDFRDVYALARR